MRLRTALVLWTVALGLAAGAIGIVLAGDHADAPVATAAIASAVGLAFVGAGLIAWVRRPENRVGVLMTLVGFTWFAGALAESNNSLTFTIGLLVSLVPLAFFAWLVLAYPSGRLGHRLDRGLVAAAFVLALPAQAAALLFSGPDRLDCGGSGCPSNLLLVSDSGSTTTAIETIAAAAAIAVVVAIAAVLVRRIRAATPAQRSVIVPVSATSLVSFAVIAAMLTVGALSDRGESVLRWLLLVALCSVPLSFLYGLARARLARVAVGRLVVQLGEGSSPLSLQDELRRALGDESLTLAYWLVDEQMFVDAEGRPVPDPADDGPRHATMVERDGRLVAALIHDVSLLVNRDLVDAVASAAGLALENERRLQEIRRNEARTRALLNAIPDLMFRIRADGTYLDFKSESERDLYDLEVIGRKVTDRLPPDVAAKIMGAAEAALADRELKTIEYELDFEGDVRHYEGRIVASGEDEFFLIVRDFSKRFRAEEELRRSEAQVRALLYANPDLMFRIGRDGTYRAIKVDDLSLLFQPPAQTIGRNVREVLPLEVAERLMSCATKALDDRTVEFVEYELPIRGELRSFEGRIARVDDDEFLLIVRDFTERKAAEAELQASRTRIVQAGDDARRRLERNLHDGAQQRLVSLSLALRLAHAKLEKDPAAAATLLTQARDELARALEELRELARGIHPAVLSQRGLAAALDALASRAPVPVALEAPDERLPEPVEAAAYYVVSEALANVAKYARASEASVRVARANGRVVVEVRDDGVGGADPTVGSGLRGLGDRIAALDGRFEVDSPAGAGTTVRAEIPV